MKIQTFMMAQPIVKKYADRYTLPLIQYDRNVPDKYLDGWISTGPSVNEIALFYMGVLDRKPSDMPYILASLERHKNYDLPIIGGILSIEYWEQWAMDNINAVMGERAKFLNGED